ncbi:hypothetical protein ES703_110617 [subsurface metagenome]
MGVLQYFDAADTRTDDDPDPVRVSAAQDARSREGLFRRSHGIDGEEVHLAEFSRFQVGGGVKIFHLAGQVDPVAFGVETGDAVDAVLTGVQPRFEFVYRVTDGSHDSHTGDDNSPHQDRVFQYFT